MNPRFLSFLSAATIGALWPAGALTWQVSINGGGQFSGDESARAVAVDAVGDVIAVGSIRDSEDELAFAAVKFSGIDGMEIWRYTNEAEPREEVARAVAVDPSGDIIVAGAASTPESARTSPS